MWTLDLWKAWCVIHSAGNEHRLWQNQDIADCHKAFVQGYSCDSLRSVIHNHFTDLWRDGKINRWVMPKCVLVCRNQLQSSRMVIFLKNAANQNWTVHVWNRRGWPLCFFFVIYPSGSLSQPKGSWSRVHVPCSSAFNLIGVERSIYHGVFMKPYFYPL